MPDALASGEQTVFWWKGNVTPPRSWSAWADLVRDTVTHEITSVYRMGDPKPEIA